ncbi:DeoR/GlpR family DNA-binding transcription regulator [Pseudonocardia nigra]|uniref:DeoR/GlpR family DNA-binding transcription regulator n=1 Tax=Pseudonocardia nigra TaxID=1921578 RepID=UPI001C5F377F|nr:DeoR/GlpR family DNA-binding transcription regulator [Pseudonocardia nigra]
MTETGLPATGVRGGAARREEIMRRLQAAGFVSVTYLTGELGVSDMTVRRDLKQLAKAGELRVVHGGASLPHGTLRTADFASRAEHEREAKRRVARQAVELVGSGATIAIDAGTTAFELAATLPDDFRGCVITHSVPVLQHMLHRPDARVIGLGGELLADSQALVGALTIEALSGLHAEVVFLGAAAVNERGIYVATDLERPTKQALIDVADRVVLLAERSKFTVSAPVRLAPLDAVDILVSDGELPAGMADVLAAAGVAVHAAGPVVASGDGDAGDRG